MSTAVPEAPLMGRLDRDPVMVARHSNPSELWYFLSPIPGMGEPVQPGKRSGVVAVHPAMTDTIGRLLTEHWVRVVSPDDHTAIPMNPATLPSEPRPAPVTPTGHPHQSDHAAELAEMRAAMAQLANANARLSAQVEQLLARPGAAAAPTPDAALEARNTEARQQFVAQKKS